MTRRILIDLDGVLNIYKKGMYNEFSVPDIKEGAYEFVEKLAQNYELYLFTTRNLLVASRWLIENNLDKFFKDVTNIKIPCHLYIDDRAICFKGNYDETLQEIDSYEVYWSKTENN